ncbi:DUF4145 domain-containing protein [Geomicrobium sediminis]|uniref:DUF4145 domain-containing protein n=1 Tax=Geomicrobium sediminis TaxID=1347788 RepID=A0ABS2PEF5_9BACL|nr:DUF4145 domain-containing protein [Geomicrobium sediminis]MBM7633815.1 hypothetical protein [Geomicrobium sediminis]
MKKKYVQPSLELSAFNCPHCEVLCPQVKYPIGKIDPGQEIISESLTQITKPRAVGSGGISFDVGVPKQTNKWDLTISVCNECRKYTIWESNNIVFPKQTGLPLAFEDMPSDVKEIYNEATSIFNDSPRASAALLRLAIETLIPQLPEYEIKKTDLNGMIGELVEQGVPRFVQKGLDSLRVVGNDSIHADSLMNIKDKREDVLYLFDLINLMVEKLIIEQKTIESFYSRLPENKLDGIQSRDKQK